MIKANELKVGNWVFADDKKTPIYIDSVCEWGERPLFGIPLTPEILEKCGFEDIGFDTFKKRLSDTLYLQLDNNSAGLKNEAGYIAFGSGYLYLHQLQNLYFALTGEELSIKKPLALI